MFSTATKVKGQGVGSAYIELIGMLKKYLPNDFDIEINKYNQADISHYHTINPSFYLSTFSKKRGRKIGYVHFLPETLEGSLKIPTPFRQLFYKYIIAFYKRMDHIVVVNPTFIPKLVAYGIPESKITYIPNFVSKKEFYPVSRTTKEALKHKYGYEPNKFTILCTGQVQTRKGVLDFAKLARENPEYQFVWVGGFSFGSMTAGYTELKKLVENPPANLSFPGIVNRDKLVDYYNLADLFLLPSYNELFPMSVLEAFSCGIPVVLRNLELYRKIIDGYYLAADDEAQMNRIINNISADNQLWSDYHHKALKASNFYSEDHLAEIWHNFYFEQAKLSKSKGDLNVKKK
ncbi:hypothetical protein IV52_GL000813 [Fructilactobacillus lindneri DSM 20690 = JCM 11027]|uniref:Glycosyltransferase n=2 Tax=Fructilactobacillus lindneri TaxID=53444 RepID=A0A0R2JMZ6_9LACO|nr:hypothetical protein IV52_GL000813 [Fructilactobacillus lindneri DSM 20690 = JCM 11027]